VKPSWEDLDSRAAGLASRLLDRSQLERLDASADLDAVASGLEEAGFVLPAGGASEGPAALELAVRREAARRLALLARWSGPRALVLGVIFEDEERRALRVLVRGAVQGVPAVSRLSGLLPTPRLPERALEELAGQPGPAAIGAMLSSWSHPFGPPILRAARGVRPDILRLELSLNRAWAARAVAAAPAGGDALKAHVRRTLDLDNALTALTFALHGGESQAEEHFLEGGELLDRRTFGRIAAGEAAAAAPSAAAAFHGTRYQPVFAKLDEDWTRLEEALLAAHVEERHAAALRDPLGTAPIAAFALRQRMEILRIGRSIWRAAMWARPPLRTGGTR
jgi:vacuolar-type H+-ATPase subunit C/Vma6